MKSSKESTEPKNHTLLLSTITSVILSLSVLVGVVSIAIVKIRNDKKYHEKWKDYDECGI
jgi:uncharacterized membrane protein